MLVGWAVCSSSPESNGRGEDPDGVEADGIHFPSTVKYIYTHEHTHTLSLTCQNQTLLSITNMYGDHQRPVLAP